MPIYAEKAAEESSEAQMAADNYLQVIYDNSEAQNTITYFMNYNQNYSFDWNIYDEYALRKTYVNQEIAYYALVDISGDGIPELMLKDENEIDYDSALYTFSGNKIVKLCEKLHNHNPSISTSRYAVMDNNKVMYECYGGNGLSNVKYYSLSPHSNKLILEEEYTLQDDEHYTVRKNGGEEKDYVGQTLPNEIYKEKNLTWHSIHNPTAIYDYFEENNGVHFLNNVIGSIDDDGLVQMQNCITALHSLYTSDSKNKRSVDTASMSEKDIAYLVDTLTYYLTDFVGNTIDDSYMPYEWDGEGLRFVKKKDVYQAAYKYFGIDISGALDEKFAPSQDKEYQDYIQKVSEAVGEECINVGWQNSVWAYVKPRIDKVYSLGNNNYYVIYEYLENTDKPTPDTEPRRSINIERKDRAYQNPYENRIRWGYAIIKNRVENGKNHYYIQQCGCDEYSFLSQTDLNSYVTEAREPSNIKIDYSKVKEFDKPQEYIDYLLKITDNVVPNDSAVTEIAKYIEYAIGHCASKTVKATGKKIKVDKETIEDVINQADDVKAQFDKALNDKGITLNSAIKNVVQLDAKGASLKKGVTVIYDESALELIDRIGAVRVVLDSDRQSVYASSPQIKNLITGKTNSVYVKQKGNKYTIEFKGENGKRADKGADVLKFIFKTSGNLDTVFYHKSADDKVNWGGQINDYDKTIEFLTSASGEYSVEHNKLTISDIGDFDEETAEAIEFMVSRGFFKLYGDEFKPFMSLSRYDFTKAIVSIFYDTDFNAESTFADVSRDNEYYTYVASAEQKNTVYGYEDNTFRGDNHAAREEVISIAARTLADKKGYYYPENTDDYVCFADNAEIQGWDNQYGELALSVREGLIDKGGFLAPKNNITRADAAVILYRLFNLLYNITPTQTQASGGTNIPAAAAGVCGGAAVLGAAAYILIKKRRPLKGGTK